MANLEQQRTFVGLGPQGARREELRVTENALGGSNATEAIFGAAVAVMAALGLARIMPFYLAAIGTIGIGVALIIEGATAASRYQRMSSLVPVREREQAQIGGGLTVEVIGGAAGIALGVLALIGIEPFVLLPIATLVFGASFLMSGGVHPALETWVERGEVGTGVGFAAGEIQRERVTHQAVNAGAVARALAGLGAAVLGTLALADVGPLLTMTLAALLVLGVAALVSGSAFSVRMNTLMHHR